VVHHVEMNLVKPSLRSDLALDPEGSDRASGVSDAEATVDDMRA
jgi:hypothetical protein